MYFELFQTYSWSFNLIRLISQGHFGGGQFSEIYETASRIQEGDLDSWYDEWSKTAARIEALAEEAETGGHPVAREACLNEQHSIGGWRSSF